MNPVPFSSLEQFPALERWRRRAGQRLGFLCLPQADFRNAEQHLEKVEAQGFRLTGFY